ncbi:hypothetical protein D3C76_1429700 [compost metagenome]
MVVTQHWRHLVDGQRQRHGSDLLPIEAVGQIGDGRHPVLEELHRDIHIELIWRYVVVPGLFLDL